MLRLIRDMVVIARDPAQQETRGGIIIPESAQDKVTRGTVLAVGAGDTQASKAADALERELNALLAATGTRALSDLETAARAAIAALRSRVPELKKGDHVLFGKYTGNTVSVRLDGKDHDCIVCRDEEVFGLIEDGE